MAEDNTQNTSEQREWALEGLLRETLAGAPAGEEECLSPEILAAYCERSLDQREQESVEIHLARCPTCREAVAAMDRAAPAVTDPPAAEESSARSNWAWLWDWRWLAPATALLALAGIWFARERESTSVAQSTVQLPLVAESRPSASVPPVAVQSAPQPQAKTAVPPLSAPREEKQAAAAKKSESANEEEQKELALNAPQQAEDALKSDAQQRKSEAASSDLRPAASAPPNTSIAEGKIQGRVIAGAAAADSSSAGVGRLEPPATNAAAPRRMATLQTLEQRSSELRIPSPDPEVIWRINAGGFVERSTDGGASWQGQQVRPGAQILAGSAPSSTVCWLVGRAGTMLVTANGTDWMTASAPVNRDLVSVVASDASRAVITTAGGKKYATADGGNTWTLRP